MSGYEAYQELEIELADPVKLVELLYQGALQSVRAARCDLAAGQIERRGRAISKVSAMLMELSASLDMDRGGEIARNLAALYQYMLMRLTEGHIKSSDAALAEVERLIVTLATAWEGSSAGPEIPGPIALVEGRFESVSC